MTKRLVLINVFVASKTKLKKVISKNLYQQNSHFITKGHNFIAEIIFSHLSNGESTVPVWVTDKYIKPEEGNFS